MSKSICLYRCREMARNNNAFSLGPMLEKEKLAANGGNYADWFRNLGFVLKVSKKDYVLKEDLPAAPAKDASQDDKNVYATKVDDHTAVQCLMLTCMDTDEFNINGLPLTWKAQVGREHMGQRWPKGEAPWGELPGSSPPPWRIPRGGETLGCSP